MKKQKRQKLNEGLFDYLFRGLMMYAVKKEANTDPYFDEWVQKHSQRLKQLSDEMEANLKQFDALNKKEKKQGKI